MTAINLGRHTIGDNQPTFIIAEVGINHNGRVEQARQLIDKAVEAGADAVKFQKRNLASLYPEDLLNNPQKYEQYFQYMIPLLKEAELTEEEMSEIRTYCCRRNITFLCTPFDLTSARFLASLKVAGFKVASADLTNLDLMEHLTSYRLPLILSTGMSTWGEIETAVALLKGKNAEFALLHCRSVYPVWPREVNLRMLNKLKEFNCPVGYSGHEIGIVIPLVAASMGAAIIEKHITLDRSMRGPDHKVSLEPYEFKRLVRDIRVADQAAGNDRRYMLRGEIINRELFAKSLKASRDIPAETVIDDGMVEVQGPGKGLSPLRKKELVGTRAGRFIPRGDYFQESDLTGHQEATDFNQVFSSQWGLIARFTDAREMLRHNPRILEFHLAEKDFDLPHNITEPLPCRLVVHGPEYMGDALHDLCSQDSRIREQSIELTIRTGELIKELQPYFLGTPKLVTHPGAMSLNQKIPPAILAANLAESTARIREGLGNDLELLYENLPPYPWYFGGQWKGNYFMAAEEIADFCRKEELGLCFDLSHASLYCNAKEEELHRFIQTVSPFIRHIHFADAYGLDGEGLQLGEGDIDLTGVMPLFRGYRGTWVPEIWRGHLNNGQGFLAALDRLKPFGL